MQKTIKDAMYPASDNIEVEFYPATLAEDPHLWVDVTQGDEYVSGVMDLAGAYELLQIVSDFIFAAEAEKDDDDS